MNTKQCLKCKEIKPLTEFRQFKSGKNKGYYFSYCKKCSYSISKISSRKYNKSHPNHIKDWCSKNGMSYNEYRKNFRHKKGISKKYNSLSGISYTREYKRLYRKKYKYNLKQAGKLSIEIIQQVYEDNIKQYGTLTCIYCLNPITFGKDTLEHKQPLSRGGTNDYENLAIACQECNYKKRNKTEIEYTKGGFTHG